MLGSDEGFSHNSDTDEEEETPQPDINEKNIDEENNQKDGAQDKDEFYLSEEKVNKIKKAMSKLNFTPPPWAKAIPEEKWLSKYLNGEKTDMKVKTEF